MVSSASVPELFNRVVKPLVLGGPLHPLQPIGPVRAPSLAQQAVQSISAADLSWVNLARVRHARALFPVDSLPPPSIAEWLMIVALNDLIRSTDPKLNGLLSPRRSKHVIDGVFSILGHVSPIHTVGEALARHATFSKVLAVRRADITVAWWCGSQEFAGRIPPNRLSIWPRLRRVRLQRKDPNLAAMLRGNENSRGNYLDAIRALLACTPLTDLSAAGRVSPPFSWSSSTVSLSATLAGRKLALRTLRMNGAPALTEAEQAVVQELESWEPSSPRHACVKSPALLPPAHV